MMERVDKGDAQIRAMPQSENTKIITQDSSNHSLSNLQCKRGAFKGAFNTCTRQTR